MTPGIGPNTLPIERPIDNATVNVHATSIALNGAAALITGASGSGKSDLALRCLAAPPSQLISEPPILVSDDRTLLANSGNELHASPPETIAGRIEVRGLGIVDVPYTTNARVVLVVELGGAAPDRMPESPPEMVNVLGISVARIQLRPFEASSPLKLLLALQSRATYI